MKYITNFFGVGCVALLAVLIVAPGAFAQTTRYVDPAGTGVCSLYGSNKWMSNGDSYRCGRGR